jgi:hypothetical protein
VLCAALLVGACGGGPAVPGPSASAGATTTAAGASPSVVGGQACATGEARTKPVPAEAQALVRAFVAAVDGGEAAAVRRMLDPAFADQVLAGLAPARRLTLLTVSDDY